MVDEIVVPVNSTGSEMPAGMKPAAKKAPVAAKAYHITADPGAKAKADSLVRAVNDSLARETSGYGLVLTAPMRKTRRIPHRQRTPRFPPQISGRKRPTCSKGTASHGFSPCWHCFSARCV